IDGERRGVGPPDAATGSQRPSSTLHRHMSPTTPESAEPPKRKTSFPSVAIAWSYRGDGPLSVSFVHSSPSNFHVSPKRVFVALAPPKRTTPFGTVAIACADRAAGGPAGDSLFHALPFHVHVSSNVAVSFDPPKSTTLAAGCETAPSGTF